MRDTIREGARGATVRELQTLLNAINENLPDGLGMLTVDGNFGTKTDQTLRAFQRRSAELTGRDLIVDGIVGAKTWDALDIAVRKATTPKPTSAPAPKPTANVEDLSECGSLAVLAALSVWATDIFDPKSSDKSDDALRCKAVIDAMIRSTSGIAWSWQDPYKGDGDFEWCGAFAAVCWHKIKLELRKTYFASTYRLDRYGSYQSAFGEKNEGAGRLYAKLDEHSTTLPFEPREGDILLIGPKGYGQHVCLVEKYDAEKRVFHTIEGNGTGEGPHGEHQQGVVRAVRPLGAPKIGMWCARRLIRPSVEDLA